MATPAPVWAAEAETAEADAEVRQAAEALENLYGQDVERVRATRETDDDVALAKRLLTAAREATGTPALMTVLCEKACDLAAAHPDGYATAVDAAEFLASRIPEKAVAGAGRVTEIRRKQYAAAEGDTKTAAGEVYIEALLAQMDAHLVAGEYPQAVAAARKALGIARAVKSPNLAAIEAREARTQFLLRTERDIANMKALLARDPSNVAACAKLVRLHLVNLDDPAAAADHLEGVEDGALRKYVPAVGKGVAAAPELACVQLGDWYRGLGESAPKPARRAMFERAKAYYDRFLSLHPAEDLERTTATLALKKVEALLADLAPATTAAGTTGTTQPTETAAVPQNGIIKPGKWLDLLSLVDPEKDAVAGKWQGTADGLAVGPGDKVRLALPVSVKGSYELEIRFTRLPPDAPSAGGANNEVSFVLPVGTTQVGCFLSMRGGEDSGLGFIGGSGPHQNETTIRPGTLHDGHPYTLKARVVVNGERCQIEVTLDGKPHLSWSGPWQSLSPAGGWDLPRSDVPAMGVRLSKAKAVFASARLRMLDGEARLLRPASGGTTPSAPEPPETVAVPAGAVVKPGKWVDLLPLVDPEKDAVEGTWTLQQGDLSINTPVRDGRILFPAELEGDYHLRAQVRLTSGETVGLLLPVGETAVHLAITTHGCGLGHLHGRFWNHNESFVKTPALTRNRLHQLDVNVKIRGTQAQITFARDGQALLQWEGAQADLSVRGGISLPRPRCPGVRAYETAATFSAVRMRMLSGRARLLR